ncbi:MAG: aminotransferase class III-fold pyridoxal phosphate-dependent enzyme, partial [Methylocella sp.]
HLAPYNDLPAVERSFDPFGEGIAAVIVEPVAANMGVIPPRPGFLEGLRKFCDKNGTVLIFDEVVTGFRVAYGGAQQLYKVTPDLTCLGKILGGGMPVGAVGGKRQIMQLLVPSGPVYQAGTLSGNPVTMAAGIETLKRLGHRGVYKELETLGATLQKGLEKGAKSAKVAVRVNRVGSLITVFFYDRPVTDFQTAKSSDPQRYARFFHAMLGRGFYRPPSPFEAMFRSRAHGKRDINAAITAAEEAFLNVSKPLVTAPRPPVGSPS